MEEICLFLGEAFLAGFLAEVFMVAGVLEAGFLAAFFGLAALGFLAFLAVGFFALDSTIVFDIT